MFFMSKEIVSCSRECRAEIIGSISHADGREGDPGIEMKEVVKAVKCRPGMVFAEGRSGRTERQMKGH